MWSPLGLIDAASQADVGELLDSNRRPSQQVIVLSLQKKSPDLLGSKG